MEYYIFVSNDCNLNCDYCSILVDATRHNLPLTPLYSIENLYDFVINTQKKYNEEIADIVFFGGEPTLNYQFIEEVITSFKPRFKRKTIRFMLHTNGLLLDKISLNILTELDAIMLSINFTKIPSYNLHESYFSHIVENINYIKSKKDISIIGRLTITEKTSLYSCVMMVQPFFDYIYWQIENCIQFEDFNTFSKAYKYDLDLLMNLWMGYLNKGILLNFIPFISCVFFINENKDICKFNCGYNNSMLYVQTDGKCYTCAEDFVSKNNLIGNIYHGIEFTNFSIDKTICKGCEFLPICQGRCGRMHREFSPEHVKEYCLLNKTQFDYFVNQIDNVNKLAKHYDIRIDANNPLFTFTEYIS